MPTRHSGISVGACSDPAYIPHHLQAADPKRPQSRLERLIEEGMHHPQNSQHLLPHRIINQGPIFWIADPATRAMILQSNDTVLGLTQCFLVDLHSACAGVIARTGMDRTEDQRAFQTVLALEHGQDFADSLAILGGHDVFVQVTYTQFDQGGLIYDIYDVGTFESRRKSANRQRAGLLPPFAKEASRIREMSSRSAN